MAIFKKITVFPRRRESRQTGGEELPRPPDAGILMHMCRPGSRALLGGASEQKEDGV